MFQVENVSYLKNIWHWTFTIFVYGCNSINFLLITFYRYYLIGVSSIIRQRICNPQDVIIINFRCVFINIFCDIKHNRVYSLSKGINSLFRLRIHITQIGVRVWSDFSTENYLIYSIWLGKFWIILIWTNISIIFITFQFIWLISIHIFFLPNYYG